MSVPEQSERLLASTLLARIEDTELSVDELLALIYYAAEHETTQITAAKKKDAQIDAIERGARALKDKAADALYE
jgi:hypothetical protein